jgi:DNA-binding NtrC family response regulator
MRRYLIVDDNVAFAENLAEIIMDAEAGAEATVVDSGPRALALAETTRFDALVSDMRMPTMGGAEVVHRIRRIDPGLPALVVTAFTADNELAAARQEGLLAALPKPVAMPRLLQLLVRARRDGVVALVEDDEALADNLTELLRERGFAAVTARNVLETEQLGIRPFVGLVDLRVPGGPDGEAIRRLAAKFPDLPLIVMTAHADAVDQPSHSRVFFKPFDPQELLDYLERLHSASAAAAPS